MSQLWTVWDSLQHGGTLQLPEPNVGVLHKPGMWKICFRLSLDKKSMRTILGTLRENTCLLSCCRTGQMRRSIPLSRASSKLKGEFWDFQVPLLDFGRGQLDQLSWKHLTHRLQLLQHNNWGELQTSNQVHRKYPFYPLAGSHCYSKCLTTLPAVIDLFVKK